MIKDSKLNFSPVNILPTTQNHILRAIDQIQKAILIKIANITGVQPAIYDGLCGGFWAIQVTLDDRRAFDTYLADLSGLEDATLAVYDLAIKGWRQRTTALGPI
ncbi:MAG: Uncharacterised protein [Halieaceae bacterium]|nr:MAG: Uncharacterised protein [Halieaceae bacterium]